MEASEAGLQSTESDAQTGIVTSSGVYAPGVVVELFERADGELRCESSTALLRGRRTVDADGLVGFDGLTPGGLYWLVGYTGGERLERRAVARDPSVAIILFQQPVQPLPLTLGIGASQGSAPAPEAAAPATPTQGDGIPDGALDAAAAAQPATAPVLETAESPQTETEPESSSQTAAESPAPAQGSVSDQPTIVAGAGTPAPVQEGSPAAPQSGEPNASESSGTGQGNGGAVEEQKLSAGAGVETTTTTSTVVTDLPQEGTTAADLAPAEQPAGETPAVDAGAGSAQGPSVSSAEPGAADGSPSAAEPAAGDSAPDAAIEAAKTAAAPDVASVQSSAEAPSVAAGTGVEIDTATGEPATDGSAPGNTVVQEATPWDQLVQQAQGLGVENANTLSDAELRQAITEKGASPIA